MLEVLLEAASSRTRENFVEQLKITLIYSGWIKYVKKYVKNCDTKKTGSFMHMGEEVVGSYRPKASELFMGGVSGLCWPTCIELFPRLIQSTGEMSYSGSFITFTSGGGRWTDKCTTSTLNSLILW